ncbi:LPXTG cell wall anchor domain-containing protein [Streptomyces palmae]|uniref:LPXTG cell wall anchor domain-containing protein n=1 Tax=Streptomyces palmae TaxID=1701085 RepID=A0A4Z0HDJ7_9ACTN|nr:LPXTG cell wall anchor domain-containing protein [Streptomyces palmae]TGB15075.1 LPXTG cell wall anchor domain-containing protein [Streptomyces palmae]
MSRSSRRALATAALVGPAALLAVAAPAARADQVDVDYQCKTPIGNKGAVSPIDITSVPSGSSYKLTMSFRKGVSSSPVELGKGAMKPSALIRLGGAETGTVAMSGPANDQAIPADTPIKISDLTGTYTPKKSGKVTFTAGTLTIKALGTTTTCEPRNKPGPALTLDVKAPGAPDAGGGAADGGSGSGGSSGTGGAAGTPGDLPQTGPADSAVALGTLGGTVLLAGAAGTLWLTRRRTAS